MRRIDAQAVTPVDELITRAGAAVAREALGLLGGAYGRRVVVLAGPGNNGADGRVAGRLLARRGVAVSVLDGVDAPRRLPMADLIIDAVLGTGGSRAFAAPDQPSCPVLAVDIPSGLDALTGRVLGRSLRADRTVTFAAMKPGLLRGDGPELSGWVTVADIGLTIPPDCWGLIDDGDVSTGWPRRAVDAHKWRAAVWVVGGSPGMTGAPRLAAHAAARAGAGYVALSVPGRPDIEPSSLETVVRGLPGSTWSLDVRAGADRFGALVLGPGLGLEVAASSEVLALVADPPCPMVVDGDGLTALAGSDVRVPADQAVVLTPHDGELARLLGRPVGDRVDDVVGLAQTTGAVVLSKGPTTVIADPAGRVRFVTSGDQRLATAGSGDVLSGIIGALLAAGVEPLLASSLGAHVHGRTCRHAPPLGVVASDLPNLLPRTLAELIG